MRKKYSLQNHRRIKHSMQAFADRAADDFGITQREVYNKQYFVVFFVKMAMLYSTLTR